MMSIICCYAEKSNGNRVILPRAMPTTGIAGILRLLHRVPIVMRFCAVNKA
jgi:hypothetical protein